MNVNYDSYVVLFRIMNQYYTAPSKDRRGIVEYGEQFGRGL